MLFGMIEVIKNKKLEKKEALYKIDEYTKILDFISKNYPECAI